ncbi:hypothetical protein CFC21_034022 [Triticum aestivum]|uniref:F-box domain-containing protein n=2 Tax=Triticum aestivum TaxID=4565 RepID=A0A9R1F2A0_WHEAT|nr:hypothetical protein CFC21_034022 [Triticum aestivum]
MKTPPDDVVREILLLLDDVVTLFRCAATCKRWRRLIAEPSFLVRRRWPPSLVGFFTQRWLVTTFPGSSPTDSSSQLAFVPSSSSPSLFGPGRRPLTSLVPNADAPAVDRAVPLATRDGLLLVRLYPCDDDLEPNVVRLAVCDTLAGRWDVLPELDCDSQFCYSDTYGYAIIPSSSGGDDRPAFRVLLIGADKYESETESQFNVHRFASSDRSWSAPRKCFDMMERHVWSMKEENAVVCRGNAHWLFVRASNHFHVLNVDVETGHVSLTKILRPTREKFIPAADFDLLHVDHATALANIRRSLRDIPGADRLATTADGTLLSLSVYHDRRLEIWTQQQGDGDRSGDGDAEWLRTRVIDHKLTELIQQIEWWSCIWSGERSGTLLIKDYDGGGMYTAHLDAGILEKVTHQIRDCNVIVPMEIDWTTFFMTRLEAPY